MTIVQPTPDSIQAAAALLARGGVVAFPTETVYGLGCDTFNEQGIDSIYALKGRPKNNPTIAHIHELSSALLLTNCWDETCDALASQFWPGPLTIILPRKSSVPKIACGGFDTVAIRMPAHPVAIELIEAFGGPVSAPSANPSGYISPTTAKHVEDSFGGSVEVFDGGPCACGIESTVLSLVGQPTILRPGSVTKADLLSVVETVVEKDAAFQVDAPGTAAAHYSPQTTTRLVSTEEMALLSNPNVVAMTLSASPVITQFAIEMPDDPERYAEALYASLREADGLGASEIIIECPPEEALWVAVLNRLQRAAR